MRGAFMSATRAGLYAGFCPPSRLSRPSAGGPPSIWDRRRRRPLAAYPVRRREAPPAGSREGADLFGLAPRRVCLAAPVAGDAGGLLPHHFTHHLWPKGPSAGFLSVAHAVTLSGQARTARLPVRKHGALWCPDVPPRQAEATVRPTRSSKVRRDYVATPSTTSEYRTSSTTMRPSCSDTMMRSRWRIST